MFGPTRGVFGDGRFNGTMQNVLGPNLVAMATKFGLGAEIQSPTGLYVFLLLLLLMVLVVFRVPFSPDSSISAFMLLVV